MKAFPGTETHLHQTDGEYECISMLERGMDLRDYFAAKAMHYWLCNPINNQQIENLCKGAYQVADAMMKAREQ